MGQKVNPTGFRTGITEDWKSRWYAPKAAYGNFLVEDFKVRKLIDAKLNRRPPFAAVSDILIERTREEVTITLKTARTGPRHRTQGRRGRQASRRVGRPDQA
jgi:small subunit ribosomal protein S3